MRGLSIGQLAKAAKVSADTIRFYEKCGLLPPAARRPSGFREYSSIDLRQLRFIIRAKQLGFSLEDIRGILELNAATDPSGVKAFVEQQLQGVERMIADLQRWREALLTIPACGEQLSRNVILESFERGAATKERQAPADKRNLRIR